jgi:hypothetical protein
MRTPWTESLRRRIHYAEHFWDLTVPVNRQELNRLKRQLWWASGPSTVAAVMLGAVTGSLIAYGVVRLIVGI